MFEKSEMHEVQDAQVARPLRKPRRWVSVGTKVAIATTALLLLVSGAVYAALLAHERESLLNAKGTAALMTMSLFAESVAAAVDFEDEGGVAETLKHLSRNEEVLYAGVWGDGAPVNEYRRKGYAREQREPTGQRTARLERFDDRLVVSHGVVGAGGDPIGCAVVVFSLARENAAIAVSQERILISACGIALLLALTLIFVTRRTVVRPLARLMRSVGQLERGEEVRVRIGAHDEVGRLAAAFDDMAKAIALRKREVEVRNADLRLVLNNVGQGFLALDPAGRISPERSTIVDRWFGAPREDEPFWDYLGRVSPKAAAWFRLGWESLFEGFMPLELCLEQLPRRIDANGRHFELAYCAVGHDDATARGPTQVIVVVSDITATIVAEASEAKQRELLNVFTRIMTERSTFMDFYREGAHLVERIREGAMADPLELFRDVHTLKGNCGLFGIESVARLCHALESTLSDAAGMGHDADLGAQLGLVVAGWAEFSEGLAVFMTEKTGIIEIEEEELASAIDAVAHHAAQTHILAILGSWRDEPVQKRFEHFGEAARALAERLGKGEIAVESDAGGLRLPRAVWSPFWSGLTHVVRNCVDHGLESRCERERAGKDGKPTLRLAARERGGAVTIEIGDDGRGVAWDRVADKARGVGLPCETRRELVAALFADGVTTAAELSSVSGRGVGLAAIRAAVQALGGDVEVYSEAGKGTTFAFIFPGKGAGIGAPTTAPTQRCANTFVL